MAPATPPVEPVSATTHALFAVVGAGTNYLVPVALFLQLPIMQRRLPERVRLASRMNLAVNVLPISLSVFYVAYRSRPSACRRTTPRRTDTSDVRRMRRDALIIGLLLGNVLAASLAAAAWDVVVDGTLPPFAWRTACHSRAVPPLSPLF
jgi:hypothetical protein